MYTLSGPSQEARAEDVKRQMEFVESAKQTLLVIFLAITSITCQSGYEEKKGEIMY